MIRFHDHGFIVRGLLLAAMLSSTQGAIAQARIEAGYVYIDGRNEVRRPGSMSDEGIYSDWRRVDSGQGAALAFRHDWRRLYVKGSAQRLTLANRNEYRTWQCFQPPVGEPQICANAVNRFRYDERYQSYEFQLGWRQTFSPSVAAWSELGVIREVWSMSGGTRVFYLEGITEPSEFALSRQSANDTSWVAAVGVDLTIGWATGLSMGIDYHKRGYFPSPDVAATTFERPSSSLLQGVLRLRQGFAGPWEGFIEYRPSEKRQYWQAGIGYRF